MTLFVPGPGSVKNEVGIVWFYLMQLYLKLVFNSTLGYLIHEFRNQVTLGLFIFFPPSICPKKNERFFRFERFSQCQGFAFRIKGIFIFRNDPICSIAWLISFFSIG